MIAEIKGPVTLEIPADPAALFIARALISQISQRADFDNSETDKLVLAIDEACTNVIRYAYVNSSEGKIILTFILREDFLEIQVRDFGKSADPATFQPRELEDIRPGGLGIHFMRSAVDELRYEILPDGGTLLRMVKFRQKQEASRN